MKWGSSPDPICFGVSLGPGSAPFVSRNPIGMQEGNVGISTRLVLWTFDGTDIQDSFAPSSDRLNDSGN